ncbi:unnamed protein product [Scytosiphon promiscuus]
MVRPSSTPRRSSCGAACARKRGPPRCGPWRLCWRGAATRPIQLERRLVPLCLRLLRGCGAAAGPKAEFRGRMVSEGARVGTACLPRAAGGVPAGRKVELLKVIGNACFRCKSSQDLVREEGGLPLVLSHCGVDEANPLLREYALLAVRNLCEGNIANQESIAALQPQGYAPDAEEALADMGLKGKMDQRGKFSVGPSLA